MEKEMNTICRTCLRSSKEQELELMPLFEDSKLPQKIKTISFIEVSVDDDLPKNVCADCIVNINLSYNFRRVIINSDHELRERCALLLLNQQTESKDGTESEDILNRQDCSIEVIKYEDISTDLDEVVGEDVQSKQELDDSNDATNDLVLMREGENDTEDISNVQEGTILNSSNETTTSKTKQNHKQRLYKCSKCDFETTTSNKYNNHIQNHEVKICNICGKFITASNMSKHVSIHSAPPVACKQCGKICKNYESLRGHLILHKGINRTCRLCGEWYKERAAYIAHVKTHKANEDHSVKCPICNKRLYGKKGLKAHIRSHTGERPYPCEFCKKGFSSSNALKTHRRQHTNERPYKCALCPMAFPQKVSLRTHLKSKHQKGDVEGS